MTKNELIAQRIKDEGRTYRITVPILIICVVAAVVLSIIGFVMGKGVMSLGPALIMISIALQIPSMIQQRDAYAQAEQEFAAYLENPETKLSETTENLIDRFEHRSVTEFKQLFITYLILGIMLLGMGIFLLVLLGSMGENNIFLEVVLPLGMAAGGVFLCFLAFKAWRGWKIARDLQAIES